jgi:DNA-directed RNA polymerase III subunit RPC4
LKKKIIKKNLKEELNNENGLFIFQFPRQIPIKDLNLQIKAKEEENTNEEPNYDENGFLISQEFKNSFQELKDNTKIGKLIIMKSGKIKIKIGDIYFDINEGSLTKFAQYSAIVTGNDDNQAFILGQPLNKKLIVTPEFD